MRVTDAKVRSLPIGPHGYNEGGLGSDPVIAPHGRWCESLPLMRYANRCSGHLHHRCGA
jgi:hypothetical protein